MLIESFSKSTFKLTLTQLSETKFLINLQKVYSSKENNLKANKINILKKYSNTYDSINMKVKKGAKKLK
jgi:hypothetical protein